MNAPFCPISRSQPPSGIRPTTVKLPVIPIATDLPSLIRAVNVIRDILRSLTTSLTVNNVWLPREVPPPGDRVYVRSPYPDWRQVSTDIKVGLIYYKTKDGPDPTQKVAVSRINAVEYRNLNRDDDKSFYWRYTKELDEVVGGYEVFKESFFERIINVHWTEGLAVEIPKGLKGTGPNGESENI